MKTKFFLYIGLIFTLLGCSFFSNTHPAARETQPVDSDPVQSESESMDGWLLPDPTTGLTSLQNYRQDLTVSFQGKKDGEVYEWTNLYQRDVWTEPSAEFLHLKTSETGEEPVEIWRGRVNQADYSRLESGSLCEVSWNETDPQNTVTAAPSFEPAAVLPPIDHATESAIETINDVSAHHYIFTDEQVTGDLWLADPGGYVVRYAMTVSGGTDTFGEGIEGEQHFEYELSRINTSGEVIYPEGCSAVLVDFPVMDGARNLHRLPTAVDYTISAETAAISQFYQDQLPTQGWTFIAAHDMDPDSMLLIFTNEVQDQSASILLKVRDADVWVSAMIRSHQDASE